MPRNLYDPVGLKILQKQSDFELAKYLGKAEVSPTADEIALARNLGVWRDDEVAHHDEIVRRILGARSEISAVFVANAFVVGLGQQRPELRSPISSFTIATHLKAHEGTYPYPNFPCADCGVPRRIDGTPVAEIYWNSSLLSRTREGGGCALVSVLADLEDLPALPWPLEPTPSDVQALLDLLSFLRDQPADSTPGKLAKAIGSMGGKNALVRTRLIEILGIIGVLEPAGHPSYWKAWTPFIDRDVPGDRNDWEYPVAWWRGTDGVNEAAVQDWFGHLFR